LRNLFLTFVLSSLLVFSSAFGLLTVSTSLSNPAHGAPAIILPSFLQTPAAKGSITSAGTENWAGYVVTAEAGDISSVKMSWIVPAVSCALFSISNAAMWVGIDGWGSNTVEQIGTSSNCDLIGSSYSAWYEFYPQASVGLPESVNPGDVISAQVTYSRLSGVYTVEMTDHTEGWKFRTNGTVSGAEDASAEWIVERPELCNILGDCTLSSLSDFGTALSGPKYTLLPSLQTDTASIGGKMGSISSFASIKGDTVYQVSMYSSNTPTYPLATPSSLQHGRSFSIDWLSGS
jgi:hypothetical protein